MFGLSTIEAIILIGLFVLFIILSIVFSIVYYIRARWKYNVVVFEDEDNPKITLRDKARLVTITDDGGEVFFLRRAKKYKAGQGKRISKDGKQIAWMIDRAGYWYNIDFGNFKKSLASVGLIPLDKNVRFATSGMRRLVDNRYESKGFMEKYGGIVYGGMFFLMILAFAGIMWYSFSKSIEMANINAEGLKTSKETMELAKSVLGIIDNIKSGSSGSGLIVASENG